MKLLFPTVIHELKVDNFGSIKKDLVNYVYEQKQRDSQGVSFSNVGGWQSGPSYSNFDNILLTTITETLIPYFSNNVLDMSKKIQYNGLWMNINRKGDYNTSHDHAMCHLAGVFWLKTPKNCGNIHFFSPHSFTHGSEMQRYTEDFQKKTNVYSSYWFSPVEGSILVFPACLIHRVDSNQSDEDRISASFNLELFTSEKK